MIDFNKTPNTLQKYVSQKVTTPKITRSKKNKKLNNNNKEFLKLIGLLK